MIRGAECIIGQDPAQGNEASAALAATRPYDMQQNGPDQERAAVATPLGCRQAEVCPYIRPALSFGEA